ncbi:MAG: TIGR00266 family protein [Panacagrimonas sp.]
MNIAAPPIQYRIDGDDLQVVEISLAPGQTVVGEPGAMMVMDDSVSMDTVIGDGASGRSFFHRLWRGLKRRFSGESLFSSVFTNKDSRPRRVAFAAPYPGKIVPIDLAQLGGPLICQKGAFLCGSAGLEVSLVVQKRIRVGLFGGEGFIMQRISGDGVAFIHASGLLSEVRLQPEQALRVDTGCLVALQSTVRYDIRYAGKLKTALFGGEGLFFASLQGPGTVWLQSLPIRRLAGRILENGMQQRARGWGARLYLILAILFILFTLWAPDSAP